MVLEVNKELVVIVKCNIMNYNITPYKGLCYKYKKVCSFKNNRGSMNKHNIIYNK